jgi:hypothetical protein
VYLLTSLKKSPGPLRYYLPVTCYLYLSDMYIKNPAQAQGRESTSVAQLVSCRVRGGPVWSGGRVACRHVVPLPTLPMSVSAQLGLRRVCLQCVDFCQVFPTLSGWSPALRFMCARLIGGVGPPRSSSLDGRLHIEDSR